MPKFEPDEFSIARADQLSKQLMRSLRVAVVEGNRKGTFQEIFTDEEYAGYGKDVPIDDVLGNMRQMAVELSFARRWGEGSLFVKLDDGQLAPISFSTILGTDMWPYIVTEGWIEMMKFGPFPPYRFLRELLRNAEREGEGIVRMDFREGEERIQRNLSNFLAYRFAGMNSAGDKSVKKEDQPNITIYRRNWFQRLMARVFGSGRPPSGDGGSPPPPGSPPPLGGGNFPDCLKVTVSCRTPGLRVHVSPAYFINWAYFGCPTTPVTSYLRPGRYIFAGDGSMFPKLKRDNGVFSIPPTFNPIVTRF